MRSTSYAAKASSVVSSGTPSSRACATRTRSNGSRWCSGRAADSIAWSCVIGSGTTRVARERVETNSSTEHGRRSLPIATLIAISHGVAADRISSFRPSVRRRRARAVSRFGALRIQTQTWVSSSSLTASSNLLPRSPLSTPCFSGSGVERVEDLGGQRRVEVLRFPDEAFVSAENPRPVCRSDRYEAGHGPTGGRDDDLLAV